MDGRVLRRPPTTCRNSRSHSRSLPQTRPCAWALLSPLYLGHCAECSWILETHDTSDGHLLSFFYFFLIFICVAGPVLAVVCRVFAASCGILCSLL